MQQYIAYGLFFVAFVAVIADLNLSFNVPEDPGYGYREGALFMVGIVLALIGWLIY
jgi:hypothetical protein